MNPKQFLILGGGILVIVGILGLFGVIGPTPEQSIFGANWWFDNVENWAHLLLGVVGFIAAFVLPAMAQKGLVLILGVVGVLVGIYSLAVGPEFFGANLENPADTVLHLAIGAWALWASLGKRESMM